MDGAIQVSYKQEKRLLSDLRDRSVNFDMLMSSYEAWYPQPPRKIRSIKTAKTIGLTALASALTKPAQPSSPSLPISEAREALVFIAENGLTETHNLAKRLIEELIPGVVEIRVGLERDDETDESWVDVVTIVDAEVSEVSSADDALLEVWFELTSLEQGKLVRIDYKFAR